MQGFSSHSSLRRRAALAFGLGCNHSGIDTAQSAGLSCAEPIDGDYSECSGAPYEDGVCTCASG